MISHPFQNFKSQSSQKEEVGSYDNFALNQRNDGCASLNPSLISPGLHRRFSVIEVKQKLLLNDCTTDHSSNVLCYSYIYFMYLYNLG